MCFRTHVTACFAVNEAEAVHHVINTFAMLKAGSCSLGNSHVVLGHQIISVSTVAFKLLAHRTNGSFEFFAFATLSICANRITKFKRSCTHWATCHDFFFALTILISKEAFHNIIAVIILLNFIDIHRFTGLAVDHLVFITFHVSPYEAL